MEDVGEGGFFGEAVFGREEGVNQGGTTGKIKVDDQGMAVDGFFVGEFLGKENDGKTGVAVDWFTGRTDPEDEITRGAGEHVFAGAVETDNLVDAKIEAAVERDGIEDFVGAGKRGFGENVEKVPVVVLVGEGSDLGGTCRLMVDNVAEGEEAGFVANRFPEIGEEVAAEAVFEEVFDRERKMGEKSGAVLGEKR